ncbi:MAG: serine/threonine-protein kinase [Myxococcota bacterium]
MERERQLDSGTQLGRYLVGKVLGAGNMGVVYSAFDPELDRTVALKVLAVPGRGSESNDDSQAQGNRRLLREAQALAKLAHPNVVKVHDVGTFQGRVFIAMEYIDGETLREWVARSQPTAEAILVAYRRAAAGLAHAHEMGLVHRDLKPDNVLIDSRGRVVVSDFGLARTADTSEGLPTEDIAASEFETEDQAELMSRTGAVIGTPAYMAPELLAGGDADARSDQFAFCVSVYESLYGRRPFSGATPAELADAIGQGRIDGNPTCAGVTHRNRRALLRGLQADPGDRFGNMRELARALQRRRVPWPWVVGVGVAGVTVAAIGARDREVPLPSYCDDVAARLDQVWDDAMRSQTRAAFERTEIRFAPQAAAHVVEQLDAYAAGWVEAQSEACERQAREGPSDQLAATMACLSTRHEALEALAGVVVQAQPQTVGGAADAVARLPSVGACAGAATTATPPPEELAAPVAALNKRSARARALRDAGMTRQAVDAAAALVSEARTVGFAPAIAEAEVMHANALADTGQFAEAEGAYHRALSGGVATQSHRVVADAAAGLGYLELEREDTKEVERWVAMATAALDAADDTDVLRRGQLLAMLGTVLRLDNRFDESEAAYRSAIAAMEPRVAPTHVAFAAQYSGLSLTLARKGESREAATLSAQALQILEATYGADHPSYGAALQNHASTLIRRGAYAQALEGYRAAHIVIENALGPNHPSTGTTAYSVAAALVHLGRHDEARPFAEQARSAYAASLGAQSGAVGTAMALVGENELRAGQFDAAGVALREAIRIAKHENDAWRRAGYVSQLGNLMRLRGDYDAAQALLDEARAAQASLRDGPNTYLAETLGRLARLELDGRGDPAAALPLARESWELCDKADSDLNVRADTGLLYARALVAVDPGSRADASALVRLRLAELDGLGEPTSRRAALDQWLAATAP